MRTIGKWKCSCLNPHLFSWYFNGLNSKTKWGNIGAFEVCMRVQYMCKIGGVKESLSTIYRRDIELQGIR